MYKKKKIPIEQEHRHVRSPTVAAYPSIECIFSLVNFISGHEHIQAHMHTLKPPVQMQENIKNLFTPGYVHLKMFAFQKFVIRNVSSTVEKQANIKNLISKPLLAFH